VASLDLSHRESAWFVPDVISHHSRQQSVDRVMMVFGAKLWCTVSGGIVLNPMTIISNMSLFVSPIMN